MSAVRRIFIFGLLLSILGSVIVGLLVINQERQRQRFELTVRSVFLTNTAVSIDLFACEDICALTGGRASCQGWYCSKSWTRTPTWTPQGLPTLTHDGLTVAAIQRTITAISGVRTACAVLIQSGQADKCPDWYLNIPTPTPMSQS